LEDACTSLSTRLENLKPDSSILKIIHGFQRIQKREYIQARDMLQNGLNGFPRTIMGWLLLTESQLALHDSTGVELSVEKAQKISAKKDCFCTVQKNMVLQRIRLNYAKALLDVGDQKSVSEAINLCQKVGKLFHSTCVLGGYFIK
jgi:predicted Zn-dependent protease